MPGSWEEPGHSIPRLGESSCLSLRARLPPVRGFPGLVITDSTAVQPPASVSAPRSLSLHWWTGSAQRPLGLFPGRGQTQSLQVPWGDPGGVWTWHLPGHSSQRGQEEMEQPGGRGEREWDPGKPRGGTNGDVGGWRADRQVQRQRRQSGRARGRHLERQTHPGREMGQEKGERADAVLSKKGIRKTDMETC